MTRPTGDGAETDRQDAIILAKLQAANLLPEVWVPPAEVRQLRSVERKQRRSCRLSCGEKLSAAVLTARLKAVNNAGHKRFREVLRLIQPETVPKWHPELVRGKWTYA